MSLDIFVLTNIMLDKIYCFCVTINCNSLIKKLFCHFCMYILVLGYDPNHLSIALVYFCSWQQITRSYILFLSNLFSCKFRLYFLFLAIIQTVWQLCLIIFVLNNKLPDHTYHFWVSIKCLMLIKYIVLSVAPVYFCSWQLSKPSIICACIFLFLITNYQIQLIVSV